MDVKIVDLYSAGDELEAARIEAILEENNIPFHVMNKDTQDLFALGRLGTGVSLVTGGFQFQVREDQLEEAVQLLHKNMGIAYEDMEPSENGDQDNHKPDEHQEEDIYPHISMNRYKTQDWLRSIICAFFGITVVPGLFFGLKAFKKNKFMAFPGIILNLFFMVYVCNAFVYMLGGFAVPLAGLGLLAAFFFSGYKISKTGDPGYNLFTVSSALFLLIVVTLRVMFTVSW